MQRVFSLPILPLLAMMVLGTACSQNHSSLQASEPVRLIVGGSEIKTSDLQSPMAAATVAVSWSDESAGRDIQCTGTLIAPDLVLTASHCLLDAPSAESVQIDFLTLDMANSLGQPKMLAKKIAINSSYKADISRRYDDLALILLPQAAPKGTAIAKLGTASVWNSLLLSGTAMGYGKSDDRPEMAFSNANGSGVLRQAKLNGLITMTHDGSGISGMVAVEQAQSGICQGDSGGPLFVTAFDGSATVVGVTQAVIPYDSGKDQHTCLGYSFFVNVAEHLDWITTQSALLRK